MEVLEKIGYISQNGLVMCENIAKTDNNSEKLLLSEAKSLGAKAVLFRRHYGTNLNSSLKSDPAVYIFQQKDEFTNSVAHKELHSKIWSSGQIDIYIFLTQNKVEIFNGRRPADVDGIELNLKRLLLCSEVIEKFNDQRFSSSLFCKGTFWDQSDFVNEWSEKDNPYLHLLKHLDLSRKLIYERKSNKLSQKSIDRLLILSLLIKFIEGIDPDGKHSLREIYNNNNVNNFEDAVDKNRVVEILSDLSQVFNGRIFALDEDVKSEISNGDLSLLSGFLKGNIELKTKQLFLWQQYDFKYLPAEVISAIYENFIQADSIKESGSREKGVVYTPIHLVNLLVDDVMPLENATCFTNETFKILDPTCGSGVFLVAAYKRLLQWWAINNSKDGNIVFPNAIIAQRIMEKNNFGVDVLPTATNVSIFGLTIALLEKLTPQEIWNNLKFNDLNNNIQCESFVKWAINAPKDFDLVIGNPPFNEPNGQKSIDILKPEYLAQLNIKHKRIPASNFALHFFEIAMTLTKKVCMILPSAVLLYSKSSINHVYRKDIFTDFSISKIYDFTHMRRILFHQSAEVSVLALIASNYKNERKPIEHVVVRRIDESENKLRFEIDHYDRHFVPWNWAVDKTKSFIWKCNLLGGGRLFHLIYRLSLLPKLIDFIDEKELHHTRGYEGGSTFEKHNVNRIINITENGGLEIESNVSISSDNFKNVSIYSQPFIIIDQNISQNNLALAYVNSENLPKFLYYKRDFFSIKGTLGKSEDCLVTIFEQFKKDKGLNSLNENLYLFCTTSSALVLTELHVNKLDILELPFLKNSNSLELSVTELLVQNDVLDYYIHLGKSLSKGDGGEKLYFKPDLLELELFGKTFCDLINPLHSEDGMSWQIGDVISTENDSFIAYQFIFGKPKLPRSFVIKTKGLNAIHEEIGLIVKNQNENRGAIFNRIVKWYGSNDGYDYVIFIKPNTRRYWLQSIALRDADEVSWDYYEEGY